MSHGRDPNRVRDIRLRIAASPALPLPHLPYLPYPPYSLSPAPAPAGEKHGDADAERRIRAHGPGHDDIHQEQPHPEHLGATSDVVESPPSAQTRLDSFEILLDLAPRDRSITGRPCGQTVE